MPAFKFRLIYLSDLRDLRYQVSKYDLNLTLPDVSISEVTKKKKDFDQKERKKKKKRLGPASDI